MNLKKFLCFIIFQFKNSDFFRKHEKLQRNKNVT